MAEKVSTGIEGFDDISCGGVPGGRVTLLQGGPGTCKTSFAWSFINSGAETGDEKGLVITFDLIKDELIEDMKSIGLDLGKHLGESIFLYSIATVDYAERTSGDFNLKGLEVVVESYAKKHGIRRLVLDSIQSLLSVAINRDILRKEIARFFASIKNLGITSVVISEDGVGDFDLDFLSDCNIHLDMRMENEKATRRIRVSKMRGSPHETNEFPFFLGSTGIHVVPLTSIRLQYETPEERYSTGMDGLDDMLEGKGYYKGSSILLSGTAGTGKTSLACWLAKALCRQGAKSLYFSLEESESQLLRNMRSIGLDLSKDRDVGLFECFSESSTALAIEHHIGRFMQICSEKNPDLVVIDPVTNFVNIGASYQIKNILMRLIDFFKDRQISSVFTSLVVPEIPERHGGVDISSLMDLWIWLDSKKKGDDRQKTLRIIKARGIDCDTSDRKLLLSREGMAVTELGS